MSGARYAEHLAQLPGADLIRLLELRPDACLEPTPRGFAELAQRLNGHDSLVASLRTIDRDAALVGQSIAGLGVSASDAAVCALLAASMDLVAGAIAVLTERGLVFADDGAWRLPQRLDAHWSAQFGVGKPMATLGRSVSASDLRAGAGALGVNVDGLRKDATLAGLVQAMRDPDLVGAAIARLPAPARRTLELHLDGAGGQFGIMFGGNGGPDEALVRAGLMYKVQYRYEVPREVAVAAWAVENRGSISGRPSLPARTADAGQVRRAAQAEAQQALLAITTLLDDAHSTPITALKRGGVGPRERGKLAKRLGMSDADVVLWIDLAHAAGLLANTTGGYAPTAEFTRWRDDEPGPRWATVAAAWLALEHAPTDREMDGDKEQPPPLALASGAGMIRNALLRAASDAAVRGAGEHIGWFCPFHGYQDVQRVEKVSAAIREAERLGVVALDTVTELGAALLADHAELAERAGAVLPSATSSVVLQSDLTAVVSGQPEPALARLLGAAAIAEGRGAAGTWRFTPASVRAAFDSGWSAPELLDGLAEASKHAVPQPLEYLVNDVARGHGKVRVRGVRSCVLADEATATEILHTRGLGKLHLSLIAPGVLGSAVELDQVLTRLRGAGFSPVAEDAQGAIIAEVKQEHVAEPGSAPHRAQQRASVVPAELAARLNADPDGTRSPVENSDTFELLAGLNQRLSDAELRLLADAVDTEASVLIAYRDKNGTRSSRTITPAEVYGRWLDSWCHLRGGQRDFTVGNIESVDPA